MYKKIIFFTIFIPFVVQSQVRFYKAFRDEKLRSDVWNAIETPMGDYLIALNNYSSTVIDSFTGSEIIKLNKFGNILSAKKIGTNPKEIETVGSIHLLPSGDYCVLTKIFNPSESEHWLGFYRFDANFNLKKNYKQQINDATKILILKSIYEPKKDRILFTFAQEEPNSYIGWINTDLNDFAIERFEGLDFLMDICPAIDENAYVFGNFGEGYKVDSFLQNKVKFSALTLDFWAAFVKQYNKKYITYSTEHSIPTNPEDKISVDIVVKFLDKNWNTTKKVLLGKPLGKRDTAETVSFRGISWLDPNKIFVGWTTFKDFGSPVMEEEDSWVGLAQLDSNLNVIWTRYYFGEGFSATNGLTATSDKGILVYGRQSFDGADSDGFVMKVDEKGILLNSKETLNYEILPITIGPIPCVNQFKIAIGTGSQTFSNYELLLYDTFGRLVKKQFLEEGFNNIAVEDLTSAAYFYSIIADNQVVKKGKIIKL